MLLTVTTTKNHLLCKQDIFTMPSQNECSPVDTFICPVADLKFVSLVDGGGGGGVTVNVVQLGQMGRWSISSYSAYD